jgi:hypothetical protein
MIITFLILALFLSFLGHIAALVTYVTKRSEGSLKTFINTTLSNVILAGTCIVVFITKPHLLKDLNLVMLSWIMSGLVMFVTLSIKIKIFITVYRRAKDPSNYHLNFFEEEGSSFHSSQENGNGHVFRYNTFFPVIGFIFHGKVAQFFFVQTPLTLLYTFFNLFNIPL